MAGKSSDGADYSSAGVFASIIDSFKANVDERLKSPFAGAFVVSWVVVNWKPILLLLFSSRAIEFRLEYVASIYFNAWTLLWLPLFSSLIGLISFYVLSSGYLFIYEWYGVLRRSIEKRFDEDRWTPPTDYIKFKSGYLSQIADLRQLATDKLDQIVKESERANAAELLASQMQAQEKVRIDELADVRSKLESTTNNLREGSEQADREATRFREEVADARARSVAAEELLREAVKHLTNVGPSTLSGLAGLVNPTGGIADGVHFTRAADTEFSSIERALLLTRIERQLKK